MVRKIKNYFKVRNTKGLIKMFNFKTRTSSGFCIRCPFDQNRRDDLNPNHTSAVSGHSKSDQSDHVASRSRRTFETATRARAKRKRARKTRKTNAGIIIKNKNFISPNNCRKFHVLIFKEFLSLKSYYYLQTIIFSHCYIVYIDGRSSAEWA